MNVGEREEENSAEKTIRSDTKNNARVNTLEVQKCAVTNFGNFFKCVIWHHSIWHGAPEM